MALVSITKQPYESFPVSVSFEDDMATDETIVSQTVLAEDATGTDATADIVDNVTNDGAFSALARISAGTVLLTPYKVTFRVITSLGNKWEYDIKLKIKEL